ncbi:hypothetical protein ZIOFF_069496 [Zingiber officinale]|uniref:Uncharacterized protein n=1 Tax=Zingiber officinale TaxID=94328 RepID=A0A8J5EU69_ZINOF|nr:hypothetical protein ZIOFF_069496 [Zingiber officinale]
MTLVPDLAIFDKLLPKEKHVIAMLFKEGYSPDDPIENLAGDASPLASTLWSKDLSIDDSEDNFLEHIQFLASLIEPYPESSYDNNNVSKWDSYRDDEENE